MKIYIVTTGNVYERAISKVFTEEILVKRYADGMGGQLLEYESTESLEGFGETYWKPRK